jgi:hypothetical protein
MKNFITDTFFHYSECSSTWPKQAKGRCCFSILRRAPNGHFYGLIRLEDERRYSVDLAIGAGEQFLRLSFLAKTVFWSGILKGASHFPSRRYAILDLSPKFADWNSDYIGQLSLERGRRYQVGVRVLVNRDGEQELCLYARPLHLRGSIPELDGNPSAKSKCAEQN